MTVIFRTLSQPHISKCNKKKCHCERQPRILAYDPDILILDEATSNIDPISEVLIQNAIKKVTKDRTSIIISHRLSTILNCDRILVLSKGEKVEEGTHETLMRAQGLYSQLYKLYLKKEKT